MGARGSHDNFFETLRDLPRRIQAGASIGLLISKYEITQIISLTLYDPFVTFTSRSLNCSFGRLKSTLGA
ncbi:MAG TPA: hypothetical protein DC054_05830 [Blastocatellia bacterium]|nr:hypothetical protein [Blastocatellia bacterium]